MSRHLLVAGAQRCGTTYLHALLEAHPAIAMARPARPEPKVFCSAELSARGAAWYRETWFHHAGGAALLGDKSTSYLEDPAAPGRAAAVLGDPLVLVQLRDPVDRAASNWSFSTRNGFEDRPLVAALRDALERAPSQRRRPWAPERSSVSPFAYLERGHYVRHLAPWWERFGSDVHVVLLEDLAADPSRIAGVYAALGVDPGVRPDALGRPVHASQDRRDPLPADLVDALREHYARSDAELAERLGRPLPWHTPTPTPTGAA